MIIIPPSSVDDDNTLTYFWCDYGGGLGQDLLKVGYPP